MKKAVLFFLYALLLAGVSYLSFQAGSRRSGARHEGDGLSPQADRGVFFDFLSGVAGSEAGEMQLSMEDLLAGALEDATSEERRGRVEDLLDRVTDGNAEEILAMIEAYPVGPRRNALMSRFFERWGEVSGRVAFDRAKEMTGRLRMSLLATSARGWAKEDPRGAWQEMLVATNYGAMYSPSMHPILDQIASRDLGLALELLSQAGNDRYNQYRFSAIVRAAANDGRLGEVFSLVQGLEDPKERAAFSESLFENWGAYELEAPLLALQQVGDPEMARLAMSGLMKGWANVDGSGAFEYVLANRNDALVADTIADVASKWARSATAGELNEIVNRVGQVEERDEILNKIMYPIAQADPIMAIDLAAGMESVRDREMNVGRIMSVWARTDLEEAEGYYYGLSDFGLKRASIGPLAMSMVGQGVQPERIVGMLSSFEDPKDLDRALASLASAARSTSLGRKAEPLKQYLLETVPQMENVSERSKERFLQYMNR